MDIVALNEKFVGLEFDEAHFDIEADPMVEFAEACGETLAKFTDPDDPDFQAVPSYTARFHGGRSLPDGFPIDQENNFDGGKTVEWKGPIRVGDRITARSHIHDIFEKTGRSGGMMFIVHRMEFSNQNEELIAIVDWKMIQKLG